MSASRFLYIILALLVLVSQPSSASDELEAAERYGANFLQQMTSAEIDGMGESFAAYSTGSRSLNNNPAGLAYINGSELLINAHRLPRITAVIMKENVNGEWADYAEYDIDATDMGLVSYALSLGRFGNLGMSFIFHYGGRFIRVNEEGKAVNSFPQDDLAFVIGYSRKIFGGVSVGFDIKNIRSKIPVDNGESIGRTYSTNVGLLHQISKRFRMGAVLQNIGKRLSFKEEDIPEYLRRRLLIGAMYKIRDDENSALSISMDVNPPFEDGLRYNLGAEFLYAERFSLKIGYLRGTETYYEPLAHLYDDSILYEDRIWIRKGITFGFGVRLGNVEIDVARTPRREPVLNDGEKSRMEEHDSIISFSCATKF